MFKKYNEQHKNTDVNYILGTLQHVWDIKR